MSTVRAAVCLAICGLLLAARAPAVQAQAAWDARLDISPYPSPYLSDWESNPAIGRLTITNPVQADRSVLLVYRVTDRGGRLLASGRSDPVLIPRGAPTVITDFVNMSGSSQHDQGLEDQMRRTGRLPEGDNTTCVAVTDPGGFVLAEDCATFSIVYPDPPFLIGPMDDASLTTGHPIFQWTPLQVPPAFGLSYVVRVSEVLAGQTPVQALLANIPVFEATTNSTTLEYPIGAAPLVEGRSYAWRVQALDQNGYAASSNDGRSDVWTFGFVPGGGVVPEGPDVPVSLNVTFFDPAGELPEVWRTLGSGSFGQFINYVATRARSGVLELPLPLPAIQGSGLSGAWNGSGLRSGGAQGSGLGAGSAMACPGADEGRPGTPPPPGSTLSALRPIIGSGSAAGRDGRQYFVLEGEVSVDLVNPLLSCFGVDDNSLPPLGDVAVQLAMWETSGGLPHVTLGIKLRLFPFQDRGLVFKHAVFVINLLGDFTMGPRDLPPAMQAFYGPYEFEVWGTGIIDLLSGLYGAARSRDASKLSSAMPGINFFGVIDLARVRPVVEALGFGGVDSLILQGFTGYREKIYRQIQLGGANSGRADRKVRDIWYIRGSVALASLGLFPGVTSRHLVFEVARRDSSVSRALRLYADPSEMLTRYRVSMRLVLGGFDDWKPYLGVHPESTLAFYVELALETVPRVVNRGRSNAVTRRVEPDRGDPTPAQGGEASLTFGTDATFQIGPVYLHDVRLTRRFASGTFQLSAGWGFRVTDEVQFERIGTLEIEPYLIPPRMPASPGAPRNEALEQAGEELRRLTEQRTTAYEAMEAERREWVVDVGPTEEFVEARRRVQQLDGEIQQVNRRIETLQQEADRATPGRRRLRVRLMVGVDQGASIAEVMGLIPQIVSVVSEWVSGR